MSAHRALVLNLAGAVRDTAERLDMIRAIVAEIATAAPEALALPAVKAAYDYLERLDNENLPLRERAA